MYDSTKQVERRSRRRRYDDQYCLTEEDFLKLMQEVYELRASVKNLEELRNQIQGASIMAKVLVPVVVMGIGVVVWLYETFQHVQGSIKEMIK